MSLVTTSIRKLSNDLSSLRITLSIVIGFLNDGQPVPESYLSSERNRGSPVSALTYRPLRVSKSSGLENGRSVPARNITLYAAVESSALTVDEEFNGGDDKF